MVERRRRRFSRPACACGGGCVDTEAGAGVVTSLEEATWHFAGMVLAIFMSAAYGRSGRAGSFWVIACRFPGTILHESAHYLVGLLTGARPVGFTVIPVRRETLEGDGVVRREWVLGAVTLRNPRALAVLPTALAPLLLLVVAWGVYAQWFDWFPRDFPSTIGLYGTVCLLCCGAVPSGQDLKVGFSSLAGVAFYAALFAAGFLFLNA